MPLKALPLKIMPLKTMPLKTIPLKTMSPKTEIGVIADQLIKGEPEKGEGYFVAEGVTLEQTPDHIHLEFEKPHRVLSSAVLNGGFYQANHFLNMLVPPSYSQHCPLALEDPTVTLERYCHEKGWPGAAIGMMTAASMKSLRVVHDVLPGAELAGEALVGESLAVVVTTGLENARRAGDVAEFKALTSTPNKVGTINMAIVTSAYLTTAAMVETVAVATEAKAAVLQELNIISPVSGGVATGTGTDAIAIFSGNDEKNRQPVKFTGKHTLFGERVAQLVIKALRSSINWPSKSRTKAEVSP